MDCAGSGTTAELAFGIRYTVPVKMSEQISDRFDIQVYRTAEMPEGEAEHVHELFGRTYRQANHDYLDRSLATLNHVAVARDDGRFVGFALGDCLRTALPRMADLQTVTLGGIGCISQAYRRQGLFGHLEQLATRASGVADTGSRRLSCGRMAHPASFQSMARNPSVVPKLGVMTTEWQREVGLRIAELYRVNLDPATFVVQGSGTPIGYPNIEIDVPASSWRIFENVDRDRGDSLLGVAWFPDSPDGW